MKDSLEKKIKIPWGSSLFVSRKLGTSSSQVETEESEPACLKTLKVSYLVYELTLKVLVLRAVFRIQTILEQNRILSLISDLTDLDPDPVLDPYLFSKCLKSTSVLHIFNVHKNMY